MEEAVGLFGMGKSCREVERITGINYVTVTREAKRRGISSGSLDEICNELVTVDEKKAEIVTTLLQMPQKFAQLVTDTADARKKATEFFNLAALQNVEHAMSLDCPDQHAAKARAETINKGRESVLGKTGPDMAIPVNNNFTLEDLRKDV